MSKATESMATVQLARHGTFQASVDELGRWQAIVPPDVLPFLVASTYERASGDPRFSVPAYWGHYYPSAVLYVVAADYFRDPSVAAGWPTLDMPRPDRPEPYRCDQCKGEATAERRVSRVILGHTWEAETTYLHVDCISAIRARNPEYFEGATVQYRSYP